MVTALITQEIVIMQSFPNLNTIDNKKFKNNIKYIKKDASHLQSGS
jgi:hypothetical protein